MGAPGTWTFTNELRTKILDGTLQSGDTYKCALFQSTSNIGAGSTTYATLTNEVANGNGYTTGGTAVTCSLSGTVSVIVAFSTPTFSASGGNIVFRFAVVYEVGGRIYGYGLADGTPADYTIFSGNSLSFDITTLGLAVVA